MKLKDIYKKIDSLNEAVNMSISMSGETADDVATLMKMVKDAGGKPEVITPMPKMSPRDDIEKSLKVMDLPPMPPKGMDDMEPGCEDEVAEKENEKYGQFVGKQVSELKMELGAPTEDFVNELGNETLVYKTKKYGLPCDRKFEINSSGTIIGFNSSGCF